MALMESVCPVFSIAFTDECKFASIQLAEHIPVGALSLLPGDVRDLRRALLGSDLQAFLSYVMILLGIKLFLRSDELLTLCMNQFDNRLYIVNDDEVRGIALYIKGKSDRRKQYLYIWADENCPEFCPLRHLLVYVAVSGNTSGYLFPFLQEVNYRGHTHRLSTSTHSGTNVYVVWLPATVSPSRAILWY
jgi:integrase